MLPVLLSHWSWLALAYYIIYFSQNRILHAFHNCRHSFQWCAFSFSFFKDDFCEICIVLEFHAQEFLLRDTSEHFLVSVVNGGRSICSNLMCMFRFVKYTEMADDSSWWEPILSISQKLEVAFYLIYHMGSLPRAVVPITPRGFARYLHFYLTTQQDWGSFCILSVDNNCKDMWLKDKDI